MKYWYTFELQFGCGKTDGNCKTTDDEPSISWSVVSKSITGTGSGKSPTKMRTQNFIGQRKLVTKLERGVSALIPCPLNRNSVVT